MTNSETPSSAEAPQAAKKSPLKILVPLVLLLVAVGVGSRYWRTGSASAAIELSGRIEGYETDLGAKVGGRIREVTVREGDRLTVGQVIARLEDQELQAQRDAAQARVGAAQQQVSQAELQIAVIDSQIQEAELGLQQSQGETTGRVNQSVASLAAAKAQLAEARARVKETEASLELARSDRERFQRLLQEGALPQQQFDQAQTQVETLQETLIARQAAVAAAQEQVSAAQGVLTQAQATEFNPQIRSAQVDRLQTQRSQAQANLAAARANLNATQASLAEVTARLEDLDITSPIAGVVLARTAEPGEVISTGTTILTIVDLDQVYLRGYVPEGDIGLVRVGQAAQVYLDSQPDRPLEARVAAIDTEASFTPENIYFKDDRVTQVFGLKLEITNPGGFAKPGMPADGKILRTETVE